jgi:hypothetical protein
VPVLSEIHTAPRFPGQSVQTFATDFFSLQGALPPGDPDFAQLQIVAGTNNALPSPGLTSMRDRPGSAFSVESFFDIAYQIDFVGAPGSAIEGLSGSTTATVRLAVQRPPLPAGVCEGVDDGSGTTELPPSACRYTNREEPFEIVDGLPPGTTMELHLVQSGFVCDSVPCGQPGGDLGGETEGFDSQMVFELKGTGSLLGFTRTLTLQGDQENHSAPRTPGDPVQHFQTLVSSWTASLIGDPDFASLTFTAGDAQGLMSPGMTTLTDVGSGTFVVDSFFDVAYQIDFEGAPGGALEGLSGSTQGTAGLIAGVPDVFTDGFESGDSTAWSSQVP